MDLELRMYSMLSYQLNGRQAGIQALHSTIEYSNVYGNDDNYITWRTKYKTVILLDGGTTNDGLTSVYGYPKTLGTMQTNLEILKSFDINVSEFFEPDLGNILTSISFLVDERVFNKVKYPDFPYGDKTMFDELYLLSENELLTYDFTKYSCSGDDFNNWLDTIGGFNQFKLRYFLKPLKLASN